MFNLVSNSGQCLRNYRYSVKFHLIYLMSLIYQRDHFQSISSPVAVTTKPYIFLQVIKMFCIGARLMCHGQGVCFVHIIPGFNFWHARQSPKPIKNDHWVQSGIMPDTVRVSSKTKWVIKVFCTSSKVNFWFTLLSAWSSAIIVLILFYPFMSE